MLIAFAFATAFALNHTFKFAIALKLTPQYGVLSGSSPSEVGPVLVIIEIIDSNIAIRAFAGDSPMNSPSSKRLPLTVFRYMLIFPILKIP